MDGAARGASASEPLRSRAMIPFLVVLFLGLLLVARVPWFTLFLLATFHLGG